MTIERFMRLARLGRTSAPAMAAMLALASSCASEDPNANLQRYDGGWRVLQVNGGAPLAEHSYADFAAPRITFYVAANHIFASGNLKPNGSFDAISVVQTLRGCTEAENALDISVGDLMSSHPRFTDNPDGTLTIEASPYSLLLRRY